MGSKLGIEWRLRLRMAEKGMFATSDLVPLLAERGVHLSREQVYRLVTTTPQRLSVEVLAALCDILACSPNDLIEVTVLEHRSTAAAAGTAAARQTSGRGGDQPPVEVRRSTIRRPSLE